MKTKDALQFLSKLTWRRSWNAAKVLSSYYWSRISGKPVQWGLPISIAIEPTTSCNLRCPECPSGKREFTRPTGMLEASFFEKTVNELAAYTSYLTFYFQGEPYLNPRFLEMVAYAHSKKMYTATSTNAHYLNDENARRTVVSGLNRLIISVDGTTQETYESYRVGGKLDTVLEGARNMVRWKKKLKSATPHLIFQFLVVKPNEHQISEIQRLGKEIGVDEVRLKTAQVYDYVNGHELIPSDVRYSRYVRTSEGTYRLKNKLDNHCWKLWHSCVITWNGKVVPCCFDKDARHELGNLQNDSFRTLWHDERYRQFRRSVLNSRKEVDICANCSEGTKVWAE